MSEEKTIMSEEKTIMSEEATIVSEENNKLGKESLYVDQKIVYSYTGRIYTITALGRHYFLMIDDKGYETTYDYGSLNNFSPAPDREKLTYYRYYFFNPLTPERIITSVITSYKWEDFLAQHASTKEAILLKTDELEFMIDSKYVNNKCI